MNRVMKIKSYSLAGSLLKRIHFFSTLVILFIVWATNASVFPSICYSTFLCLGIHNFLLLSGVKQLGSFGFRSCRDVSLGLFFLSRTTLWSLKVALLVADLSPYPIVDIIVSPSSLVSVLIEILRLAIA